MAIVARHVSDGGVCGEIDLGGGNGSLIGSGRPPHREVIIFPT